MKYQDIVNLPHYVSKKHPPMSLTDRAAQFSPFAALVGFDESIDETNRTVEQLPEFDEGYIRELNEKLQYIAEHADERPLAEITYFVPDKVLDGGTFSVVRGNVKKVDKDRQLVCFEDRQVEIKAICKIEIVD